MRADPQTELTELRELVVTLQAALEQSRQENALLRQKVDALVRRGIDPYAYLRDVLTRLPHMINWQIPQVTPQAWAKARRTTTPAKAS